LIYPVDLLLKRHLDIYLLESGSRLSVSQIINNSMISRIATLAPTNVAASASAMEHATKTRKDEAGCRFNDFPGISPCRQTAVTDASLILSCRPGSPENSYGASVRRDSHPALIRVTPTARIRSPHRAAVSPSRPIIKSDGPALVLPSG